MQHFTIELDDGASENIEADCYKQEGPLTTFFAYGDGRQMIDSWSHRVASYRTTEVVAVRRKTTKPEQLLFSVA